MEFLHEKFLLSQPVRKATAQWDSQFLQLHSYVVWYRAAWRNTILSDTQQFEEIVLSKLFAPQTQAKRPVHLGKEGEIFTQYIQIP